MTNSRHYLNSPITEAVIDIKVELSPDFKVELLEPIYDRIKTPYPKREDLMMSQINFQVKPETATKSTHTKVGYRFWSADEKHVVQTRTNGFTFSRLHPYEHWDSLRSEARKIWTIYKEVASPIRAVRVAVRYINRIDIPLPRIELSDYLRTFPEISRDLPQTLNNYVMQLLIPEEDFGGVLSLIQATVPSPQPQFSSINLDIDLYKESVSDFDSDEKIWQLLETLRNKKNEIFEGCITESARALFGPMVK